MTGGALLPGMVGKALDVRLGLSVSVPAACALAFQALLAGCAGRYAGAGAAAGCLRAS